MHLLIPLPKQIKRAMPLPDRVPVALPELRSRAVNRLDGRRIGDADFIRRCAHKLAVLPVQRDHGRVHVACARVLDHP